jgi:hypothetical protein
MGHRANFILIDEETRLSEPQGFRVYASRWGALSIMNSVFWGPKSARNAVDHHDPERAFWYDEVDAEGGILMDCLKKKVLFYAETDELGFELPLRRACFEMAQHFWQGWEFIWAWEGIHEFHQYLKINTARHPELPILRYGMPMQHDNNFNFVLSVCSEKGDLFLYPLTTETDFIFTCDSREFLSLIPSYRPEANKLVFAWSWDESLNGGLHLDIASRRLEFWSNQIHSDGLACAQRCWPGWSVKWVEDQFERQETLTQGRFRYIFPSDDQLLEDVKHLLLTGRRDIPPTPKPSPPKTWWSKIFRSVETAIDSLPRVPSARERQLEEAIAEFQRRRDPTRGDQ